MKGQPNLIEALNKILESQQGLSHEDRATLIQVRNELKKAKTKKQIKAALTPLLKLLHYAKEIIEFFTG